MPESRILLFKIFRLAEFSLVFFALAIALIKSSSAVAETAPLAEFVGRAACVECHAKENKLWEGSHHDRAMAEANEKTVNGDFGNTSFSYHGVTSTFYKKNKNYFVRTDGPDGKLKDFQIKFVFGFYPLEQYLIEFPGGRLQALNVCWDSRPKVDGGQRWFHLYPNENIDHTHPFHWTGSFQNWNFMCAECHSTNVKKNYDLKANSYNTTWSEIDVSCEACHGPGSAHIAWGEAVKRGEKKAESRSNGLTHSLKEKELASWLFKQGKNTAERSVPRTAHAELATCARCHSRRGTLSADYVYGKEHTDQYNPTLLDEHLYHADGQIQDEVYVWGSFLQSKMYQAGVTCTDCHDPHSGKRYAEGNDLCGRCHMPSKFDTPQHHFHKTGSSGASCISCHAPRTNFMVVDPRSDHSFRIPRPDLSEKLETPNACSMCHQDKPLEWSVEAFKKWYGASVAISKPHYGETLHAGRLGAPGAVEALVRLAGDREKPEIVRASAFRLLREYPSQQSVSALNTGLTDASPLIRYAAVGLLEILPPSERLRFGRALLQDKVTAVRYEASRVLAGVPQEGLSEEDRQVLSNAAAEYERIESVDADRAAAHSRLGNFHSARGELKKAEQDYQAALRLDPKFASAYANLADLYRALGQDAKGEEVLRRGLKQAPNRAELLHTLGLLIVRKKQMVQALPYLKQAAELVPENPHFAYVYAVGLHSTGDPLEAEKVLKGALEKHPYDRETLYMLLAISREQGNANDEARYSNRLKAISSEIE